MKFYVAAVIFIAGVIAAVWVGLWWGFIGGIVQGLEAIKMTPIDSYGIAWGLAKLMFGPTLGWLIGIATFTLSAVIAE